MRLLLCLSLAVFTLHVSFAQDDPHDHDRPHGHEMSGEMSHDAMSHDAMDSETAFNVVAVGGVGLELTPLVTPDARLHLQLATSETAALDLTALSPDGDTFVLDPSQNTLDLGSFTPGLWRLSGSVNGTPFGTGFSAYHSEDTAAPDGLASDLYTVFAPTPALSNRARTEAFAYLYDASGEPVHGAMTLQRGMTGMQHAGDDDKLPIVHVHISDVEGDSDNAIMGNRGPVSFAMAGPWQIAIEVTGASDSQTFALTANVLNDTD